MRDKRIHERYPIEVEVEVTIPKLFREQRRVMRTRDMSHGGLFLESDGKALPPLGAELKVRVLREAGDGEALPVVRARVVRVTAEGIAIEFISS